ncbi:hypothetical protein IMSHALPRED_003675 [Imshaugia aleurites]|uniref:HIT domain-containing protein n=1 Tax=Imshaugia aleurites TaxID=172621 RepID=A0A8H3PK80_9LECA|nr:hypothetical protein IMSHALPRED_003675 [Imshaugia aleurites]
MPPPSTSTHSSKPCCPFCAIALANPASSTLLAPTSPPSFSSPSPTPNPTTSTPNPTPPTAHIVLSTPQLIAFLDHAPISRGHVLVVVREHREKLGDVRVAEGEAVGRWLGVVSRAVVGAVAGVERGGGEGGDVDVGDWNVVQNNGARAAQVVPHVHFHIIPRVGDVPEVKARSWTVFGKGQREDLDEDDAVVLVKRIRERLLVEVEGIRRREGEEAVARLFGDGRAVGGAGGGGGGDGLGRGSGGRSKL